MGVNKAALEYGVPKTTLKNRIAGRIINEENIGPKPYLTPKKKKFLIEWGMVKLEMKI